LQGPGASALVVGSRAHLCGRAVPLAALSLAEERWCLDAEAQASRGIARARRAPVANGVRGVYAGRKGDGKKVWSRRDRSRGTCCGCVGHRRTASVLSRALIVVRLWQTRQPKSSAAGSSGEGAGEAGGAGAGAGKGGRQGSRCAS